jgi:hypothetical protein
MLKLWDQKRESFKKWHDHHLFISFFPILFFLLLRELFRIYVYYKSKLLLRWNHFILNKSVKNEYSFKKFSSIDLTAPSKTPSNDIIISFIGASRKNKNPNNRLSAFLNSLCKKTFDLTQIEMILRIDNDDELEYYKYIYQSFGQKICIKFVLGDRKTGYKGIHHFVNETLDYLAPSSKIIFGITDDCYIKNQGWDKIFFEAIKNNPDNMFFINTKRDFYLKYESRYLFFLELWRHGPAAYFPAISRRIIDILKETSLHYPGWTAFGNSMLCDSFFETLQFYLWEMTGQRRVVMAPTTIDAQPDISIADHKEGALFTQSPVFIKAYEEFLTYPIQKIIEQMSKAIAAHIVIQKKETSCMLDS